MRTITADDLADLARGAAVLGTGGGGDPHVGRLLAEAALREHGPVTLVGVDEVPDDAVVLPVAMMGAPTVMVEKLPSVDQVGSAVRALARYLGRTPTHLACIEAGGVNSTIPFVAAAQLGLPLVDGDGMGRAFPELQMVLPTLAGVAATPMAIVDEKGNRGVLETVDNNWAERLARTATIDMGCSSIISLYAMSGVQLRGGWVAGTLSLCDRIGRTIREARAAHDDPVAAVAGVLGARVLHTGKVVDVARRTATGFARGEGTVEGLGEDVGHRVVLHFQNEHLIAERDGGIEATTPDLIIVLESDTGEPITTEGLRFGQRVSVLAAPCDPRWHTEGGLELVGPRYFGYDTEPVRAVREAVA
ncbi:DUF917 domain-containing protein [Geodermatophilus sp. DSM 44513]|uniref:DUF917 domain-containing protein n=1 Tax=Geodermatophilus sp. DSM 44513 TaxID=1528104 RepID=UPI0012862D69|nr:DUF917 domain-containing protein [Geodermatophilus sp. DSM 44513]WNV77797.1 DUF917 domain-containing protein [Geodermatophilus sp. DSM 44513]